MVLEAVVAGSIVAGTGVGIVFKITSWMRNEKERRIEAEERREARQLAREEKREARQLAREEKREARHEADMQSLRADARERNDRLCAAISAIGEKVDGLSVRVARLEGEFRSFRDFVRPIVQSLARPDPAPRDGAPDGDEQPAADQVRGAPPAGDPR